MLVSWLYLALGLFILVKCSDFLVDGAVALSRLFGLSPLVVGLTVVAYGTSLPEFVVSLLAALDGVANIAVGNVVGSNIANFGLAWGAAVVIGVGSIADGSIYRRELPAILVSSLVFCGLGLDGVFTALEGSVLLVMAVLYTVIALRTGEVDEATEAAELSRFGAILRLMMGIGGLILGADLMVDGAVVIARGYGVDERVIALTVLALGTSLPEIAATVTAARRNEGGLALGNVIGSCFFNLTFVIGGSSLFTALTVDVNSIALDMPVMLAMTALTAIFIYRWRSGRRWHGIILGLVYFGFLTLLGLQTFSN